MCYSPLSIEVALLMTLEGARGETAKELSQALQLPGNMKFSDESKKLLERLKLFGKSGIVLEIANAIFVANEFSVQTSLILF